MTDYKNHKGPGLKLSREDCQRSELNEYDYAMTSLIGFISAVCSLYRNDLKSASIAMEEIMEAFDSKDNFLAKRGEE